MFVMSKKRLGVKRGRESSHSRHKKSTASKKKTKKPKTKKSAGRAIEERFKNVSRHEEQSSLEYSLNQIKKYFRHEEKALVEKHKGKFQEPVGLRVLSVYLCFIAFLYLVSFV